MYLSYSLVVQYHSIDHVIQRNMTSTEREKRHFKVPESTDD